MSTREFKAICVLIQMYYCSSLVAALGPLTSFFRGINMLQK